MLKIEKEVAEMLAKAHREADEGNKATGQWAREMDVQIDHAREGLAAHKKGCS